MIRKIDHCLLAVFMTFGLMTAGCLDLGPRHEDDGSRYTEDERPPLGLGLKVPASLPPPGPFVEGPDLTTLEEFLLGEAGDILVDCGRSQVAAQIAQKVAEKKYAGAINTLTAGCATQKYQALAKEAMEEGKEREVYDELMADAKNAVEAARQRINNHPRPGSKVETQFMSYLMGRNIRDQLAPTRVAPKYWEPYENGSAQDELTLSNAYLQLTRPVERSEALIEIIDRYPWKGPLCESPDVQALAESIRETVNRALEVADEYGDDEYGAEGHGHYRQITVWLVPEFEIALENEWWPRMLMLEESSKIRLGYWENLSAPAWPTFDEAQFMLTKYRNETRSVWTEQQLTDYIGYFRDDLQKSLYDWEDDYSFGGAGFLRLMDMGWPFAEVECPEE